MCKYAAIEFKQYESDTTSDQLILFGAKAKDISAWAGIPRKGWQIRMLFQRPITPTRDNELKKFWNQAANPAPGEDYIVGPSAIIVAIQGPATIKNGQIDLEYQCPVDLLLEPPVVISELSKLLLSRVTKRLSVEQNQILKSREGFEFTDFPDIQSDYVFEFSLQLQQMQIDAERFIDENNIDSTGINEIITSMEAVLRPAIVVDGQHRLHGASSVSKDIILPVVAIPHCPWTEQIYQFVVINEKAQRVDASLLSDIFGSSLTSTEQSNIRNKLMRSNVEIESRIASVLANRNADSPFANMIIVKMEGRLPDNVQPYISERTIRALIDGSSQKHSSGWRTNDRFYNSYVKPTISNREEWSSWTNGKWIEYWFSFWTEVKNFYNKDLPSDKLLWHPTRLTNLTKAVTLRQFQTLFMDFCIEEMERIEKSRDVLIEVLKDHELVEQKLSEQRKNKSLPDDIQKFREFVRSEFLDRGVPSKVFSANWKTSLDDAQGQEEVWEVLKLAFDNYRKGQPFKVSGRIFDATDS